jgi:acetolactate synthase-1/2/3 large subunit
MRNGMPNFAGVAHAYGLYGYRIESVQELKTILFNQELKQKAVVIDVNVVENENCYPMVAPGRSNSQMLGLEKQNY